MKTPKTVLDLIHNAKFFLPADNKEYRTGVYVSVHAPGTPMRCECVYCWDGSTLWRAMRQPAHYKKDGWSPVHPIGGTLRSVLNP